MGHIHTGPGEHDHTASAYIVRLDTAEPSLMLHMHRKLSRYMQYGGHIELDENPWEAVRHELFEESGYELDQLKILQPPLRLMALSGVALHPYPVSYLTHQFPGMDHYHTDTAFAFTASQPPRHALADGESQHAAFFTADELRLLPAAKIYDNVREVGLFVLEQCLGQWDAVDSGGWQ